MNRQLKLITFTALFLGLLGVFFSSLMPNDTYNFGENVAYAQEEEQKKEAQPEEPKKEAEDGQNAKDKEGMVNELERIKDLPEFYEVNWLIGLGFCLIDMKVFKQMRQPWFLCHSKNVNTDGGVNEDAHFSELVMENGFKIWVDRTIQCLHIDFKNQKVFSFDKMYDLRDYAR